MNRAALIRGIQLVVAITLVAFAMVTWRSLARDGHSLGDGLEHVHPAWLALAMVAALQEGVCGGMRMFVLGRVLCPKLTARTAVASEFVLMFVAGVTPGQLGAPIAQVATLVEGGMPLADIATAELATGFCTIVFFLGSALGLLALRRNGLLDVPGASQLDFLVGFSSLVFGSILVMFLLSVLHPPMLKAVFRGGSRALSPVWHGVILSVATKLPRMAEVTKRPWAQRGALQAKLLAAVDQLHKGFWVYLRRGKRAMGLALLFTVGFFWARFSVAFLLLKALEIPTEPSQFVTIGPPIVQVILVQTLLNFALYLSPTPGASGIAEAGSVRLMSPWVRGAFEVPYLVLWRLLALFLCMFVGGLYVFRYLGTDVLERRAKEAEAEEAKAAAAVAGE